MRLYIISTTGVHPCPLIRPFARLRDAAGDEPLRLCEGRWRGRSDGETVHAIAVDVDLTAAYLAIHKAEAAGVDMTSVRSVLEG